jgi:hypothetical protein
MSSVAAAYMYAHEQKARSARSSTSIDTPRASVEQPRQSSQHSSSLKRAAQKIVQAAKDHHHSVNTAFDTYYGTNYYKREAQGHGKVQYSD